MDHFQNVLVAFMIGKQRKRKEVESLLLGLFKEQRGGVIVKIYITSTFYFLNILIFFHSVGKKSFLYS